MPDTSSIRTAVCLVARAWDRKASQGLLRRQSLDKLITVSERFLRFADALDIFEMKDVDERLLQAFIDAPGRDRRGRINAEGPAEATRRSRRWTLSLFCAEARRLGLTTLCPILDTSPIAHTPSPNQCDLTPDDIRTLRFHAERGMPHTRHASILALLLAGLGTGEIGLASTADLDLEHRRIWASGTQQLAARFCALDEWSCSVLDLRAAHVRRRAGAQQPVPLTIQAASSDYTTQASICTAFGDISRRSGALSSGRRAKPRDVTAYTAAQTLADTGHITQVALRLGVASLDVAARRAGLRWDQNRGQR
ncbi:hypothetical protein [Streptacidiphilus carbonis]|uniref:hypothetical protein n=1 Tax=Streptacidiphilus carbonis TaxID=105422 RepID=UPI0005A980EA|nr:hypothetical protein [Streptacidiphilus carbonis]